MDIPIRIAGQRGRQDGVSIFRLKFRDGTSIGPALLKRIWSLAAGSEDVSVSRDSAPHGLSSMHASYIVGAFVLPRNLDEIEANLRRLLQDRLSGTYVELRRLV
jgi:hypothetical protein